MRLLPLITLAALCVTACVCTNRNEPAPPKAAEESSSPDGADTSEEVTLSPLDNQPGYRVSGPQGLDGTLTFDGQQWHLDAAFEFPTAGYTVKDLDVAVLKRLPEEVHITIPYQPPPIDALVAQVLTHVPVTYSAPVSKDATFKIYVQRIPPTTAAEAGL